MRLTTSQIETIRQAARQNFGAGASVWLFGSRVDDARRGGDVDLYIEPHSCLNCDAKSHLKTDWICTLT